jgi:hypothetical protein
MRALTSFFPDLQSLACSMARARREASLALSHSGSNAGGTGGAGGSIGGRVTGSCNKNKTVITILGIHILKHMFLSELKFQSQL